MHFLDGAREIACHSASKCVPRPGGIVNVFKRIGTAAEKLIAFAKKQGAVLAWGNFLTLTLNFVIVAFVLFMVIRAINQLKRKQEVAPSTPPKPTREEELLTEIRDLLKKA